MVLLVIRLFGGDLDLSGLDLVDEVVGVHAIDGAADRLGGSCRTNHIKIQLRSSYADMNY